jgi:hypothetical protein
MFLGNPALHHSIACSVLHMFAVYLSVSSPSSLSVEPDTDVAPETDDTPVIGYTPDDPSLAAELPGRQPPLEHAYIAYSLLSTACTRICCCHCLSHYCCIA